MLSWTKQFNIFCLLDNQGYSIEPQQYEYLLAVGVKDSIESNDLEKLDEFLEKNKEWVFGHLAYDLKDSIFPSESKKENKISFTPFYFFVPEYLLLIKENELTINARDPQKIYNDILTQEMIEEEINSFAIQQRLSREEYINKVRKLQSHILRGDCYEINFCQEFFAEEVSIDPIAVFQKLMSVSPNPFSALYRLNDKYLICASPERFLMKQGNKIICQPIKGTIKRNLNDNEEDKRLKTELVQSQKERSENVMVVDLVRNDLSKICKDQTVHVEELFGIYSFPQVHQMISTISGELKNSLNFSSIIEATFPMGSMTGAPKHRVIELIDQYEEWSRGIFSGSVGYFDVDGNFDFNVVIRSIMFNSSNQYFSYQVGSGITFYSDAEKEWEECLLKAEGIKKVLTKEPAPS